VLYHVLIIASTFGFWSWWLLAHPNDLQNAAVPLTIVAVFLSLFWSSAGVLKVFREQD
jgi:membrane protein YdbS with pleckstrin-like domain